MCSKKCAKPDLPGSISLREPARTTVQYATRPGLSNRTATTLRPLSRTVRCVGYGKTFEPPFGASSPQADRRVPSVTTTRAATSFNGSDITGLLGWARCARHLSTRSAGLPAGDPHDVRDRPGGPVVVLLVEPALVAADPLVFFTSAAHIELRLRATLRVHRLRQPKRQGLEDVDQVVGGVRRAHVQEQDPSLRVRADRRRAPAPLLTAPDVLSLAGDHPDTLHQRAVLPLQHLEVVALAVDDHRHRDPGVERLERQDRAVLRESRVVRVGGGP